MTRFAGMNRWGARGILAAALAFTAVGVAASFDLTGWEMGGRGSIDLEFYRKIVERIHRGGNYYDTLAECLVADGYATHSVLHWRQPTLATLIGRSPDIELWRWILLAAALASVIAAVNTFIPKEERAGSIAALVLLMGGAFAWNVYEADTFLSTEPWCEVLILFSLCGFARGWWLAGIAAAAMALTLRELVLPYCVAMAAFAVLTRNRREMLGWLVVFALYAAFFAWHRHEVALRQPAASPTSVNDWLRPPNLHFVLTSSVMNVLLRMLPPPLVAVYVPVAMLGLAGWPEATGRRLLFAAGAYIAAYSLCLGYDYWGYMHSAVLVVGAMRAPGALRDLWKAAFSRSSEPAT